MRKAILISAFQFLSLSVFLFAGGVNNPSAGGGGGTGAQTGTANTFTALQTFGLGESITAPSGAGNWLLFSPAAIGAQQLMRFKTNDATSPATDFGIMSSQLANAGNTPSWPSEPRQDNIFGWGYNMGPGGSKISATEHQFGEYIESYYKTGAGLLQLENYYNYTSGDGTVNYRPFSQTINLATNACDTAIRTDQFEYGDKNNGNDWLKLTATATTGNMGIGANAWISFATITGDTGQNGARLFIQNSGNEILARNPTTSETLLSSGDGKVRIGRYRTMGDGVGNLEISMFQNSDKRTLRHNQTTHIWEATDDGTVYYPLNPFPTNYQIIKLSGSLTSAAGDWRELGNISATFAYGDLLRVDIIARGGNNVAQSYVIPRTSVDATGSSWYEVVPLYSANPENFSLDVRPNGTGSRIDIRLRRNATGSGTTTFEGILVNETIESWTATGTTGTGATVASLYSNSVLHGKAVAFGSVPAAPVEGMTVPVTDSTTATWGATITGGGTNHVLGYYNGTNWTVMGK